MLESELPTSLSNPIALADAVGSSISELQKVIADPRPFYRSFDRFKPDGGKRTITPPVPWLRTVQRRMLDILTPEFRLPSYICGGVRGKSISSHASRHVGKRLVYTLDVQKFFPNTRPELVEEALGCKLGVEVASFIAAVCSYKNGLPQGSPTSMFLANIAFLPVDRRFHRLCRKHELEYSRYVDDIAISGDADFRHMQAAFVDGLKLLGYVVADGKMHWRFRDKRQIVTGLVVNDVMRPTREYRRGIFCTIRNCIANCPELVADEEGLSVGQLKDRLNGQVAFLGNFDPELSAKARRLLNRAWASR